MVTKTDTTVVAQLQLHVTPLVDQLDLEPDHLMYQMLEAFVEETFNDCGKGAFRLTLERLREEKRNTNIMYGLAICDAIICDAMSAVQKNIEIEEAAKTELDKKVFVRPALFLV
jgi:hypothetical protein